MIGETYTINYSHIRKRRWFWGRGGYYQLDVYSDGRVSVPAGEKAWRALWDYAPTEKMKAAYCLLGDWFKTEGAARKGRLEAAALFGKKARRWLAKQKLNRQQAEEGERNAQRSN